MPAEWHLSAWSITSGFLVCGWVRASRGEYTVRLGDEGQPPTLWDQREPGLGTPSSLPRGVQGHREGFGWGWLWCTARCAPWVRAGASPLGSRARQR